MDPAILSLIEAVFGALAPIATEMMRKAMAGEDPLDALAHERVEAIIPAPLRLELALAAERARRAAA